MSVKHYIITNRDTFVKNGMEHIREEGKEPAGHNLRFGIYEFDENNLIAKDDTGVTLFKDWTEYELKKYQETGKIPLAKGSQLFFEELYKAMKTHPLNSKKGDTLVFVHGFNSNLCSALEVIKLLHDRYVKPPESPIAQIVMFTWPARKSLLRYRDDQKDAQASGFAMGRAYRMFREFLKRFFADEKNKECERRLHLMCHSMGNQVLEAMIKSLTEHRVALTSVFQNTVLVGADADYDSFEEGKPFSKLIDICEAIHIFYHKKDRALTVSETTKNKLNRLGKWGPRQPLEEKGGYHVYDITPFKDDLGKGIDDFVNHWSYYTSSDAIRYITKAFDFTDKSDIPV